VVGNVFLGVGMGRAAKLGQGRKAIVFCAAMLALAGVNIWAQLK